MIGFNYKILAIFMNIIVIISTFKSCSNSSKLLENCVKSREKRLVSGINFERVTSIIFGPEFISNDMTFRSWLISDRIFGYIIGGKKKEFHVFIKCLNIIFNLVTQALHTISYWIILIWRKILEKQFNNLTYYMNQQIWCEIFLESSDRRFLD